MQSYRSLLYNRTADFATQSSFTSERSLLSGNSQPVIWHPGLDFTQVNRQFRLRGRGVLGSTATPASYKFTIRLGPTNLNGTVTTDPIIGISPSIACSGAVSNKMFEFSLDLMLATPAIGVNATVTAAGWVESPGAFAAPYKYALEPSAPDTATWTQTIDCTIDNYINVNITSTESNASDAITLKHLVLEALN